MKFFQILRINNDQPPLFLQDISHMYFLPVLEALDFFTLDLLAADLLIFPEACK